MLGFGFGDFLINGMFLVNCKGIIVRRNNESVICSISFKVILSFGVLVKGVFMVMELRRERGGNLKVLRVRLM